MDGRPRGPETDPPRLPNRTPCDEDERGAYLQSLLLHVGEISGDIGSLRRRVVPVPVRRCVDLRPAMSVATETTTARGTSVEDWRLLRRGARRGG